MDSVDRIVEEHRVIAGPVLWVLLWFVSDGDVPLDQELAMKVVDLLSTPRPQRNVIDADGLVAVRELAPGTRRLNANVAVRVDISREVVVRLVFHVQGREAVVSQPPEQRVVELDGVVIVQYRELDVADTAPTHPASLRIIYYAT